MDITRQLIVLLLYRKICKKNYGMQANIFQPYKLFIYLFTVY